MPELDALLGPGAVYEGDLAVEGDVRLEGTWRGRLRTAGHLEIAPTGHLDGEAEAASLLLAGRLEGAARVEGELHLLPGSQLAGNVQAGRLRAEPGCCVDGWLQVALEEGR